MTIQGVVLLAFGIIDIVVATVLVSSASTSLRVNSSVIGVIVLFVATGLLRTRVFVSDTDVTVRNLWRTHRLPWTDVTGIVTAPRQVTLVKTDGTTVPCLALTPRLTKPGAQEAIDVIKSHIVPVV